MTNELFETLFERYCAARPTLSSNQIKSVFRFLRSCFSNGKKVLVAGNGGSASDAEHIVAELVKSFRLERALDQKTASSIACLGQDAGHLVVKLAFGLPAYSLNSQMALLTAMGNDIGFEYAFAQEVMAYGDEGDVLWCISTSGNSADLVNAALIAKAKGMKVVSLLGRDGGRLFSLSDSSVVIPEFDTARIQEKHIEVYHLLCEALEEAFYGL